ncbi:PREDICTED: condensin complex subunit 1-like [Amphimedon queenslandica]|uniref:Condensin complex subunit 1 n=1 Tax=Amphimedon queenslandica TaxID=400682 RepID=A0A1X7V9Q3_AMPQE|nr:PREDICTED: condensin complex subunit 1-like [Amphimedon queenslandica]|eukprot:XP_019850191.1 PREDICTED: condensin complex subunit 1-like [Amphimedon queenslandica]
MEFCIPLSRDELLPSKDGGRGDGYTVRDLLTSQELTSRIDECQSLFAEGGVSAITESFDTLYNVLHHFSSIAQTVREHYWNIVIEALVDACRIAVNVVSIETVDKPMQRSIIKMLVYIVCQFIDEFESLVINKETMTITKNRKTKKSSANDDRCGLMWEGERERVLVTLTQFLDQDLTQFWDPPAPEMLEDITNLVVGVCCKMLENPSVCRVKDLRGPIGSLLGLIAKKYNQKQNVSLKLVQLVQATDHCVSAVSGVIKLIIDEYDIHSLVTDIIKLITDIDPQDMSIDSSGTKNYSSFLVELSGLVAADMLPSIEPLLLHLEGESYIMRNAVLTAFGEIIVSSLTGSEISMESRNTRNLLLERLTDHIHDVNAFVRSKCLQIWQELFQNGAVPLTHQKGLLALVRGRVKDKSSIVRKNSLQLLTIFITHNPYGPNLSIGRFKKDLSGEEDKLKGMLPSKYLNREREGEMEGGEREGESGEDGKEDGKEDIENGDEADSAEVESHKVEVAKQMAVVQYHRDALDFVEEISKCLPVSAQLLGSKLNTDVSESLQFLAAAVQFELPDSQQYIKKSLVLSWSLEQSIKDLLISVYVRLYLTPPDSCPPGSSSSYIASNLIALLDTPTLTLGDLSSLQQLINLLIKAGHIPKPVLGILWDVFSGSFPGSSPANSLNALILLTMMGETERESIQANVLLLLEYGLKIDNLIKAKWSCIALQKLSGCGHGLRYLPTHEIFVKISELLLATFESHSTYHWSPLAEQAIILIYALADGPDLIMGRIIKGMASRLFGGGACSKTTPTESIDEDSVGGFVIPSSISSLALSRFFYVLGQTAKQFLIHLEVSVSKERKRRRTDKKRAKTKEDNEVKEDDNDDIGLSGATEDDVESELFKKVCDTEVCGSGLLGSLLPLLVTVVTKPGVYASRELQSSATLSLSKFMLLSSRLCDKYLRLLFSLLENSPDPVVRSNIIISLGDMTIRYPNLIEPWTPHLYSRLRDPVYEVRLNSVVVLTHLILNDMVKVKGQISEMALCLEDSETRIIDRTKLFFHELSQKGNALYNIIPDIISHLSDPVNASNVTPDTFRNIMKYLLSFVKKERQSEGLVEKLCHRFRATRTEQQSRDLAFCLSQLNVNERGLRKLHENLPCYQGLLSDTEVYNSLLTAVSKGKKLAKGDKKPMYEEFETKLADIHHKGSETDENIPPETPSALNKEAGVPGSTAKRAGRVSLLTPSAYNPLEDSITGPTLSSARRTGLTSLKKDTTKKSSRKGRRKKVCVIAPDSDED